MRQKTVLINLRWAFPEKNEEWYQNIMEQCYKFFTKEFLDFISFPKNYNSSKVKFKNLEVLTEAHAMKKGIILVGSHYGSFDKLFYALSKKKYHLSGVAYKQNNNGADIFFKEIRENFMDDQLYKGGDIKQLKNSLVKNNILILLSDQDAKKKGIKAKFFGIDSSTHSGAAILSKRNKSPIIYTSITQKDDIYEVKFVQIDTSRSIKDIVQQYTTEIEKTIINKPEQYFWFHKRWKSVRKYR
tara:strand:+ start:941 stop:1666 length:726 start_codon:yes stop_codon:yes gene_type:complete